MAKRELRMVSPELPSESYVWCPRNSRNSPGTPRLQNGPSAATFDDVPGLSAVHMRLMTPSYTLPQFSLPGIRDPRGVTRSRAFRLNVARLPATPTRPSRGPWLAIGLCCPDGSSLTTASSETLNPSPPLMDSRRGLLHPRKSA